MSLQASPSSFELESRIDRTELSITQLYILRHDDTFVAFRSCNGVQATLSYSQTVLDTRLALRTWTLVQLEMASKD